MLHMPTHFCTSVHPHALSRSFRRHAGGYEDALLASPGYI
jgi:hypothetical protein